jgi:hypothetical protein
MPQICTMMPGMMPQPFFGLSFLSLSSIEYGLLEKKANMLNMAVAGM